MKIQVNKNIVVFPNPSSGDVHIKLRNAVTFSRILVVNIAGEVVSQEILKQKISGIKTLNLNSLPSVIYFVEVLSSEGKEIYKSKIIITK